MSAIVTAEETGLIGQVLRLLVAQVCRMRKTSQCAVNYSDIVVV
jgi:EAL domain-containing protein (putative c-di-GMP-specific phosphodiesterase class I)